MSGLKESFGTCVLQGACISAQTGLLGVTIAFLTKYTSTSNTGLACAAAVDGAYVGTAIATFFPSIFMVISGFASALKEIKRSGLDGPNFFAEDKDENLSKLLPIQIGSFGVLLAATEALPLILRL